MERQLEGIAAAKARGIYKGRKPSIDVEAVRKLHAPGQGGTEVARQLGISRASVYRLLRQTARPKTRYWETSLRHLPAARVL